MGQTTIADVEMSFQAAFNDCDDLWNAHHKMVRCASSISSMPLTSPATPTSHESTGIRDWRAAQKGSATTRGRPKSLREAIPHHFPFVSAEWAGTLLAHVVATVEAFDRCACRVLPLTLTLTLL